MFSKMIKKRLMVFIRDFISWINFSAKRFKLHRTKYYIDTHKLKYILCRTYKSEVKSRITNDD